MLNKEVFSVEDKPLPERRVIAWIKGYDCWMDVYYDEILGGYCDVFNNDYYYPCLTHWMEFSPPSNGCLNDDEDIDSWLKSICNTTEGDEYLFCGEENYFYFRVKKRNDSAYTILWGFSNWPRPLKTKDEIKSALIALGAMKG